MFQTNYLNVLTTFLAALLVALGMSQSAPGLAQDLPVFEIKRHGVCRACPRFILQVSATGEVIFDGQNLVNTKGISRGRMTQESLKGLFDELDAIGYFQLSSEYKNKHVADAETIEIRVRKSGRDKTVVFDDSAGNPNMSLSRFVAKVSAAAEVRQWICPAPRYNDSLCAAGRWMSADF